MAGKNGDPIGRIVYTQVEYWSTSAANIIVPELFVEAIKIHKAKISLHRYLARRHVPFGINGRPILDCKLPRSSLLTACAYDMLSHLSWQITAQLSRQRSRETYCLFIGSALERLK